MMSSELLLGEGKKPDYGAQIGVPGSVSNWDSSSTPQSTASPQVYRVVRRLIGGAYTYT